MHGFYYYLPHFTLSYRRYYFDLFGLGVWLVCFLVETWLVLAFLFSLCLGFLCL